MKKSILFFVFFFKIAICLSQQNPNVVYDSLQNKTVVTNIKLHQDFSLDGNWKKTKRISGKKIHPHSVGLINTTGTELEIEIYSKEADLNYKNISAEDLNKIHSKSRLDFWTQQGFSIKKIQTESEANLYQIEKKEIKKMVLLGTKNNFIFFIGIANKTMLDNEKAEYLTQIYNTTTF